MRGILLIGVLAGALAGGTVVARPGHVTAAETHANCFTFDSQGNIVPLAPNCTETFSMQGGTPDSKETNNPCDLTQFGTLTRDITHQVFHITVDGAMDFSVTGTQNGTATFTADGASAPTGTGEWASWLGGSLNNRNAVISDTFDVVMHLDTGQVVTFHLSDHTTFNADGSVTSSFTMGGTPVCH